MSFPECTNDREYYLQDSQEKDSKDLGETGAINQMIVFIDKSNDPPELSLISCYDSCNTSSNYGNELDH